LKADFIASLPYAAVAAAPVIYFERYERRSWWSGVKGSDLKMLSHPKRERSARRTALTDENKLMRISAGHLSEVISV
jgi:hypothetical protein